VRCQLRKRHRPQVRSPPRGAASNLSVGTSFVIIVSAQAHLTRVSPLSRPGIRPGIRPVIQEPLVRGPRRAVSVSCCLSAAGIRFSGHPVPARGVGPSSRSAYRHRHRSRTRRGFHVPHSRVTTGLGALSTPGDGGAHPGPDAVPGQRLPHSNGMSLHPAVTSHYGATIHEASTKVHAIHPSGLPLARDPRAGQGSFGFPLGLRTLPLPATHAKGGARHRARARDYTTDTTSALLTASPLAKCDLVSQRHVSSSLLGFRMLRPAAVSCRNGVVHRVRDRAAVGL
jgi:hypothetical protein